MRKTSPNTKKSLDREALKRLSGKIRLDLDWKKLERAELGRQVSLKRRRHGR